MARPETTPAQARAKLARHISAAKRAIRTLETPLDDAARCYCDNPEGLTEAECGCQHVEAARILMTAGCYARRAALKGLLR